MCNRHNFKIFDADLAFGGGQEASETERSRPATKSKEGRTDVQQFLAFPRTIGVDSIDTINGTGIGAIEATFDS